MATKRELEHDCYVCGEPAAFAVGGISGSVELDEHVTVEKICYSIDTEAIIHTTEQNV